jgi:hypothetical protein
MKISRKRRHEAMLEQGMHAGNTDAKFDPPPAPVGWRRLKTAAKGWISVRDELPALDDTVVCTDGKHRWLDMRMAGFENLIWQGHLATHWHAIDALPTPTEQHDDV